MADKTNNKQSHVRTDDSGKNILIIGESARGKVNFNIQSSGTKPYDTSTMLKPSSSNKPNKQNNK